MTEVEGYDLEFLNSYLSKQNNRDSQQADDLTLSVLDEICAFIQPGVKESEAIAFAKDLFEKRGAERIWHQPLIRFADHTALTFKERPSEDYTLKSEDIVFIDIGLVFNGIEGDAGRTLCFGDHEIYQEITSLTEALFIKARNFWADNELTGIELYQYIHEQAAKAGYEFNLEPAGHLIGQFSHAAAKWRDGLSRYPGIVYPYQWILEIQIKHPELNVGGFYEKLLY